MNLWSPITEQEPGVCDAEWRRPMKRRLRGRRQIKLRHTELNSGDLFHMVGVNISLFPLVRNTLCGFHSGIWTSPPASRRWITGRRQERWERLPTPSLGLKATLIFTTFVGKLRWNNWRFTLKHTDLSPRVCVCVSLPRCLLKHRPESSVATATAAFSFEEFS